MLTVPVIIVIKLQCKICVDLRCWNIRNNADKTPAVHPAYKSI